MLESKTISPFITPWRRESTCHRGASLVSESYPCWLNIAGFETVKHSHVLRLFTKIAVLDLSPGQRRSAFQRKICKISTAVYTAKASNSERQSSGDRLNLEEALFQHLSVVFLFQDSTIFPSCVVVVVLNVPSTVRTVYLDEMFVWVCFPINFS